MCNCFSRLRREIDCERGGISLQSESGVNVLINSVAKGLKKNQTKCKGIKNNIEMKFQLKGACVFLRQRVFVGLHAPGLPSD